MEWVGGFKKKPRKAFVVHGEERQSLPFAQRLKKEAGIRSVVVPELRQRESLG